MSSNPERDDSGRSKSHAHGSFPGPKLLLSAVQQGNHVAILGALLDPVCCVRTQEPPPSMELVLYRLQLYACIDYRVSCVDRTDNRTNVES